MLIEVEHNGKIYLMYDFVYQAFKNCKGKN